MPRYEKGPVRIHYEETGSGFPLFVIPGGGLNSALSFLRTGAPFDPMKRYQDDFRCISADVRNASPASQSARLSSTARGTPLPTTSSASWTTLVSASSWSWASASAAR